MQKIAITMGEPDGIGSEIILKALQDFDCKNFILIGNKKVFEKTEKICSLKLPKIEFINIEGSSNGEIAYLCLKKACDLANEGKIKGIATAPLSKFSLKEAGYNYSGQTEILSKELSDNDEAQMLFCAKNLKILLLTRHLPIKDVPNAITQEKIIKVVKILDRELKGKFNIKNPKIAICALNPHAGENGMLGREEIDTFIPALTELKKEGINITNPISADSLLGKAVKNAQNPEYDAYIAAFHDQALPCIKSLGMEEDFNVTIGLKVLRVSPSHGTATDIAYKNCASYGSMHNTIQYLL